MIEIFLPQMGESVEEGTVLKWLKKEGEEVLAEEPLLEIATDKVDTEIHAPQKGVLAKILVPEGAVAKVGGVVARLSVETSESVKPVGGGTTDVGSGGRAGTPKVSPPAPPHPAGSLSEFTSTSVRFYSPLVKAIARREGIALSVLDTLSGSGLKGRLTKQDLLDYLGKRKSVGLSDTLGANVSIKVHPGDEVVEMDRMRRVIADRMLLSKRISPHVTSFVEADVTHMVRWRHKYKRSFYEKENEPLTLTPLFVQALVKAIKDYPSVNVSVDGHRIVQRGSINVGIAVALPSGHVIVPVIREADRLSLYGMVKKLNDLARRARKSVLKPEELEAGTYTLSNLGSFGNVMGTPIIVQPQVAILAVGVVQKKPVVIETSQGDTIGVRHRMFLSHSYDHRVIDGSLGGAFARKVADHMEAFSEDTLL